MTYKNLLCIVSLVIFTTQLYSQTPPPKRKGKTTIHNETPTPLDLYHPNKASHKPFATIKPGDKESFSLPTHAIHIQNNEIGTTFTPTPGTFSVTLKIKAFKHSNGKEVTFPILSVTKKQPKGTLV